MKIDDGLLLIDCFGVLCFTLSEAHIAELKIFSNLPPSLKESAKGMQRK